jgi:virginiamycin B lyase
MDKYPLLRWWLGLRGFWDRLVPWADGSWVRSRSPMFPQCRPQLVPLEDRWLPSSGIIEYTVPTSSSSPVNLALGPDGNVWFTETATGINKIAKITTAGTFTEYSLNSGYTAPYDITAGPDGNMWFTEAPSTGGGALGKSTTSGSITDYGFSGFNPRGSYITATRGSDGSLYVAVLNKIGKMTTGGTFTTYTIGSMDSANDITLGPDGNLWFCDGMANEIGRMTPSGTFTLWSIPTASSMPVGITAGPDGAIWFTENGANKIGRVTSDGNGTFTEWTIPTVSSAPTGITAGPDGNLWFVENSGNKVGRLTLGGTFTEWSVPTMASGPSDIVVGADNNLWFTETNSNKIGTLAWTLAANVRSDDPVDATMVPYGPSSVSPQTGNARLTIPLDYEQSTMPFG